MHRSPIVLSAISVLSVMAWLVGCDGSSPSSAGPQADGGAAANRVDAEAGAAVSCEASDGGTTGNLDCDTCIETSCCTERSACSQSPECAMYFECGRRCGRADAGYTGDAAALSSCVVSCGESNVTGERTAAALNDCMREKCRGACR